VKNLASFGSMRSCGVVLATLLLSSPLWADDLTDSNSLLCYGWSASVCSIEGECELTAPWQLNMPDFLKIDLETGIAETTETAPEARETEIQTLEREDGTIVLQGRQGEGAFSWLILEATGEGTLTMSTPGEGITVFTLCTPTEDL
jgi:hypothetical protein